ncbi:hypothetical protein ACFE04_018290 [Oxalis oulophora]
MAMMASSSTHFFSTLSSISIKPSSIKTSPLLYSTTRHHHSFFPQTHSHPISTSISASSAAKTQVQIDGQPSNPKNPSKLLPFRVGHGFDLHRLEPGYPLIIGGINIPHDRGCEAHSDGLPDIGQIFPDTDPKWKGADSSVFIKEAGYKPFSHELALNIFDKLCVTGSWPMDIFCLHCGQAVQITLVRLMHEAGYEIGNLDATLILQRPKLSPHKEAMKGKLSELLGADPSVVNLKAKTHEKVDSLGENRSIAAHTVVLLMKK